VVIPDLLPRHGVGVVLRRLAASDLDAFQSYRGDAELGRYQDWSAKSDAEARAFLAEMSAVELFRHGEWAQIGIADPDSLVLLGDIGLFLERDGKSAKIGFTLRRESHGRGIATRAVRAAIELVFEQTNAECVLGIVDALNEPSIHLLERVGMCRIETVNTVFRDAPCIEHTYAVSRPREPLSP
jgi:aminoglycoside 6'-N-acetyltransferase